MRHLLAILLAGLLLTAPVQAQPAITEFRVRAQVQGAVKKPGVYVLPSGSRVAELVARAGGPRADAQLNAVNLARRLVDGELCYVPSRKETAPVPVIVQTTARRARRRAAAVRRAPAARPVQTGPIDLNTATLNQLDTLPGVGPSLAAAILQARRAKGRFQSVEDLREIQGIGKKRFDRLRPLVRVH